MTQGFKDSLTYSLSFLSILATGAAAIVAAGLVSNWKIEHNYSKINDLLIEMIDIQILVKQEIDQVRDSKLINKLNYYVPQNDNFNEFLYNLYYEIKDQTHVIRKRIENLKDIETKILFINNSFGNVFVLSEIDYQLLNEKEIHFERSNCLNIIENLLDIIDEESHNLYLWFMLFEAEYFIDNRDTIVENLKDTSLVKTIEILYRNSELFFNSKNFNQINTENKYNRIFDFLAKEIIKNIKKFKDKLDEDTEYRS